MAKQAKKRILKRLKNKYRMVILQESTYAEKFSMLLSPLNVIMVFAIFSIFIIAVVLSVIVFTPLKELIPGYSDTSTQTNALKAAETASQLQEQARLQEQYLNNLKSVLEGNVLEEDTLQPDIAPTTYENISFQRSREDSLLRQKIEQEERYNVSFNESPSTSEGELSGMFLFTPL